MKKLMTIIVLCATALVAGCYYDKEELLYANSQSCSSIDPKFSTDISPIFQTVCSAAGCHNTGSTNGVGPLTNYTQIKNSAVHIKTAVESRYMPQGTTLTTAQIRMISCWVSNGAPNN